MHAEASTRHRKNNPPMDDEPREIDAATKAALAAIHVAD
jgi:hypothetical protein